MAPHARPASSPCWWQDNGLLTSTAGPLVHSGKETHVRTCSLAVGVDAPLYPPQNPFLWIASRRIWWRSTLAVVQAPSPLPVLLPAWTPMSPKVSVGVGLPFSWRWWRWSGAVPVYSLPFSLRMAIRVGEGWGSRCWRNPSPDPPPDSAVPLARSLLISDAPYPSPSPSLLLLLLPYSCPPWTYYCSPSYFLFLSEGHSCATQGRTEGSPRRPGHYWCPAAPRDRHAR